MMEKTAPIPGAFAYVAWNIDLGLFGPFVRGSSARQEFIGSLRENVELLRRRGGVSCTRLLESTFVAPVRNHPRFDVMLLINGSPSLEETVSTWLDECDVPGPALVAMATNNIRFGDTDGTPGPILLNHFSAQASASTVAQTWVGISNWYGSTLGVTNSTLLEFDGPPFAAMNYAAIPGPVPRFMFDQLLRPSFYRNVNQRLQRIGARALPVFARRVD